MAQIFVSHSRRDGELVNFFSRAFTGTNVKGVYMEFEDMTGPGADSTVIKGHIEDSNALFVILSANVDKIPHTRDWVTWEAGCGFNKDIWIFEPESQRGEISMIIPAVDHYVVLGNTGDDLAYLRGIIDSYDNLSIIPTVAGAAGAGALAGYGLAKERKVLGTALGALIGGLGGYLYANKENARPQGIEVECSKCRSIYRAHLKDNDFRCPVCNTGLHLQLR